MKYMLSKSLELEDIVTYQVFDDEINPLESNPDGLYDDEGLWNTVRRYVPGYTNSWGTMLYRTDYGYIFDGVARDEKNLFIGNIKYYLIPIK